MEPYDPFNIIEVKDKLHEKISNDEAPLVTGTSIKFTINSSSSLIKNNKPLSQLADGDDTTNKPLKLLDDISELKKKLSSTECRDDLDDGTDFSFKEDTYITLRKDSEFFIKDFKKEASVTQNIRREDFELYYDENDYRSKLAVPRILKVKHSETSVLLPDSNKVEYLDDTVIKEEDQPSLCIASEIDIDILDSDNLLKNIVLQPNKSQSKDQIVKIPEENDQSVSSKNDEKVGRDKKTDKVLKKTRSRERQSNDKNRDCSMSHSRLKKKKSRSRNRSRTKSCSRKSESRTSRKKKSYYKDEDKDDTHKDRQYSSRDDEHKGHKKHKTDVKNKLYRESSRHKQQDNKDVQHKNDTHSKVNDNKKSLNNEITCDLVKNKISSSKDSFNSSKTSYKNNDRDDQNKCQKKSASKDCTTDIHKNTDETLIANRKSTIKVSMDHKEMKRENNYSDEHKERKSNENRASKSKNLSIEVENKLKKKDNKDCKQNVDVQHYKDKKLVVNYGEEIIKINIAADEKFMKKENEVSKSKRPESKLVNDPLNYDLRDVLELNRKRRSEGNYPSMNQEPYKDNKHYNSDKWEKTLHDKSKPRRSAKSRLGKKSSHRDSSFDIYDDFILDDKFDSKSSKYKSPLREKRLYDHHSKDNCIFEDVVYDVHCDSSRDKEYLINKSRSKKKKVPTATLR